MNYLDLEKQARLKLHKKQLKTGDGILKNTKVSDIKTSVYAFVKWLCIALVVGIVGGIIGSVFHHSIDYVTELREKYIYLIILLPIGGVVIAAMYKLFQNNGKLDTNCVIEAVREDRNIPIAMLPLIFMSTVITHFLGGSAGREGAALQLGGSIGYNLGKVFHLKKNDLHMIVMTGMSAVFAALFGTPLTAAIFSLEVTNVGAIRYTGLFPCVISSVTASHIATLFHISPVRFGGIDFGIFTWEIVLKIIVLALLCALLSILFCFCLEKCEEIMAKYIKNIYYRALFGGALIVVLTFVLGTFDYNGAGMDVIGRAIAGTAKYEAPLLKIIFTAITISAGFKGGEIVPTFFIGATFGAAFAALVGLDASLAAAIGFVALFCGVTNCPLASIFLSIEVFGVSGILLFVVAVSVCYRMSGSFSLYKSQKIVYSKTDDVFENSTVQ